jgi:hypothetical protein
MDDHDFILEMHHNSFWFILSLLIYAPVTLFALPQWPEMKSSSTLGKTAQVVNDVANTLLYLGFAIGLYSPQKKYSNPGSPIEE